MDKLKISIPINELTAIVVDLCIKIHSRIGPGCFEGFMRRFYIMS